MAVSKILGVVFAGVPTIRALLFADEYSKRPTVVVLHWFLSPVKRGSPCSKDPFVDVVLPGPIEIRSPKVSV